MFVHIRCIFGHASCSLVAMLGNLSRPWTTASDQHEAKQAKQARTYDNITMKPTQASNAKAYTGIYMHEQVIRTTSDSNSDTTGASASALIASATTRVRHLHDMTQSGMQAIRSLFIHERLHVRASTAPCIRRPWIIQASRLYPSLHQRTSRPCASPQEHSSTSTLFDFDINGIDADNFNPCSGLRQATPRLRTLLSSDHRTDRAATSTTNHVDHVSSGSAELRLRRPRTTSTTSRAALPSSDHLDHQTTSQ